MRTNRINPVLADNIRPFIELGRLLRNPDTVSQRFDSVIQEQSQQNTWFTPLFCHRAIDAIADMLGEGALHDFAGRYPTVPDGWNKNYRVAVISAGNIPLAGFHDFCCILLSGNDYVGKLSSKDKLLLPVLAQMLIEIKPALQNRISFVEKLARFDAIIATGSDNSARYFEYYFRDYPHLLRHNRNSVAIVDGHETDEELKALCEDIYLYFGLGCRSVSKLFVPEGYDFAPLIHFLHQESLSAVSLHNQYLNNLEYQKAIRLMNSRPYIDAGTFILSEEASCCSPISVLHYQYYENLHQVQEIIGRDRERLQCVVARNACIHKAFRFGSTQKPALSDYPDDVDILEFLGQVIHKSS